MPFSGPSSAKCSSSSIPQYLEGDLTRIKSIVVSRQTCAKISEALGMQEFLILGKGMTTHPTVPPSLLADVFESLVAAIYLDGGDEAAREFLDRHMGPEIELAAGGEMGSNYKSLLQQLAQREHGTTPTYQLLDEKGPDHSKCFKIAAQVGSNRFQPAWGRNKKEAEQRAARNALSEIRGKRRRFRRTRVESVEIVLESALAAEPGQGQRSAAFEWLTVAEDRLRPSTPPLPQENRNARSAVPGAPFSS